LAGGVLATYFKVSGIGAPMSSKACRGCWSLGEHRDGDLGAGVPDLVAGQRGQVLQQAVELW